MIRQQHELMDDQITPLPRTNRNVRTSIIPSGIRKNLGKFNNVVDDSMNSYHLNPKVLSNFKSREKKKILKEAQLKQDKRYKDIVQHFRLRRTSIVPDSIPKHSIHHSHSFNENKFVTTAIHIHNDTILAKKKLKKSKFKLLFTNLTQPIDPNSSFNRIREAIILLFVVFQTGYIPLVASFNPTPTILMDTYDMISDALFLFDLFLSFNTSYEEKDSTLITSRYKIIRNYVTGWFIVDAISSIPIDLFMFILYGTSSNKTFKGLSLFKALRMPRLLRLLRLVRVLRIARILHINPEITRWLMHSRHSNLFRLASVILMICLISHFMACAWRSVAEYSWFPNHNLLEKSLVEQYIVSFYQSILLIQGQDVNPLTSNEQLYCTMAMLIGSIVLAIIFGNVAMYISNFNAHSTAYHRKKEILYDNMRQLRLPIELQERIHSYYDHLWNEYGTLNGKMIKFLPELNKTLALEVSLFLRMEIILKVPFLRETSPDVLQEIILNLSSHVFLPSDYIVHVGEIGNELYLINQGTCEITIHIITPPSSNPISSSTSPSSPISIKNDLLKDNHNHLKSNINDDNNNNNGITDNISEKFVRFLKKGAAFGELSLIMNYRRSTNVRAKTYVEVNILKRCDFQDIVMRYKSDRKQILKFILLDHIKNRILPISWDLITEITIERRKAMIQEEEENDRFNSKYNNNIVNPLKPIKKETNEERENRIYHILNAKITPEEAAEAITEDINNDIPDDTIKFGIHNIFDFGKNKSNLNGSNPSMNNTNNSSKYMSNNNINNNFSYSTRQDNINITEELNHGNNLKTDSISMDRRLRVKQLTLGSSNIRNSILTGRLHGILNLDNQRLENRLIMIETTQKSILQSIDLFNQKISKYISNKTETNHSYSNTLNVNNDENDKIHDISIPPSTKVPSEAFQHKVRSHQRYTAIDLTMLSKEDDHLLNEITNNMT